MGNGKGRRTDEVCQTQRWVVRLESPEAPFCMPLIQKGGQSRLHGRHDKRRRVSMMVKTKSGDELREIRTELVVVHVHQPSGPKPASKRHVHS